MIVVLVVARVDRVGECCPGGHQGGRGFGDCSPGSRQGGQGVVIVVLVVTRVDEVW